MGSSSTTKPNVSGLPSGRVTWQSEQNTIIRLSFIDTVHIPLFFRKMVEIEGFALRASILHECQNYLGGGSG